MERKIFFVLQTSRNITGAVRKDGFVFKINDIEFNGYKDEYGDVHIIDVETGISVFKCYAEELPEMEAMQYAIDRISQKKDFSKKYEEMRNSDRYKIMVQMFKAFKHGKELQEKLRAI